MLGLLRGSWAGLIVWGTLWTVDGRPYSSLLWIVGLILSGLPALIPAVRSARLGFLAGVVVSSGLWWLWRRSDGSTGPALLGTDLSERLEALAPWTSALAAILLWGTWKKGSHSVLLWLSVSMALVLAIGALSGPAASAGGMEGWLMKLLHLDRAQAETATLILRKAIHFSFYGVVAWSAFWSGWHGGLYAEQAGAFGLFFALSLAGFDELRQSRAQGRSGSPWDVGLDLAGAGFMVLLAILASRRLEAQSDSKAEPTGNLSGSLS